MSKKQVTIEFTSEIQTYKIADAIEKFFRSFYFKDLQSKDKDFEIKKFEKNEIS